MLLSMDHGSFDKRNGQVTMNLLYTILTYKFMNIQQERPRLLQLIILAVFRALDEPRAPCKMV